MPLPPWETTTESKLAAKRAAKRKAKSMRVLLYLTVETPDLFADELAFKGELEDDEARDIMESAQDNIIEGLTSVDMQKAIGDCLAQWFLSVRDEDVDVSIGEAVEIQPAKDKRKLLTFKVRQSGGITQVN